MEALAALADPVRRELVAVLAHGEVAAGELADRFPHRTVMVSADLVRGLLYLVLAGTDLPVPWVLALAFLAGMGDPPFVAAYSAALPQLAGDFTSIKIGLITMAEGKPSPRIHMFRVGTLEGMK